MTTYNEFTKVRKHASAFRYRLALYYAGGVFHQKKIDFGIVQFPIGSSLKFSDSKIQLMKHWVGQESSIWKIATNTPYFMLLL